MQTVIRKATAADFPAIYALMKAFSTFQQTPEKVTITLPEMLSAKDIFQAFVADSGDKGIIGFASFFFAYYSWSGKALYLDDLFVLEAYRRGKTGTRLLETVIAFAKKEKCKKVRWQVSRWNIHAISFYRKMGALTDDVDINCDLLLKVEG